MANDQIEIKDLDPLAEVSGDDQIAVQRASDGKLYRADKDDVKGDAATVDVHSTETGLPGTDANVTNEGTTSAAEFKFIIPRGDKGETGDTGAQVESVEFIGNNMVFTLDDESTITLTDAKLDLKGDTGETGASIISAAFNDDDLVFTKDDDTTVTLVNAKITLKGEKGDPGDEVQLRVGGEPENIQWKLSEEAEWNNIIAVSELKGDTGEAGKEVELRVEGTNIEWRLEGESWATLIALAELKGDKGDTGDIGIDWQGDWSAGEYTANQGVYHVATGSSYIATTTTSQEPPHADWDLVAKKGADGEGAGDVVGPESSVHENIAVFNGVDGKLIKDGGAKIADKANITLNNLNTVAMNASLQWDNTAARTFDIAPTANTVVGRALTVSAGSTVTGGTADMAGGNLTLNSGLGKGTGASSIIFNTGRTLTTGSTLQTLTEAMRILGSGNVGIGTTSPSEKLQINGNLNMDSNDIKNANQIDVAGYLELPEDGGATTLVDLPQDSAVDNVEQSYAFQVGGTTLLKVKALADGAGGIKSASIDASGVLNLQEGTASKAPIKFVSGTLLTTPVEGVMEYFEGDLYITTS